MAHYKYFIVGGGMTAGAAVSGIRKVDPDGSIGLVGNEEHLPYKRPWLSKGLWTGKTLDKIWLKKGDGAVDYLLNRRIQTLDAEQKQLVDEQGELFTYEKLLLATGGTPRKLPFGEGQINYFRTLDDYQDLRNACGSGKHFTIIGGGFTGWEVAAALAMNGESATMVFPERSIGALLFPADLSNFLSEYYQQQGVDVIPGELATDLERFGGKLILKTDSGREISSDYIIAGIGIHPNTELAENAGLEIKDGIVVDEYLHTNRTDIFAAGDVAYFLHAGLGEQVRVEHEDNALSMGEHAGKNMARQIIGEEEMPYTHQPYFYSDLFDLGFEAVGELNPRLQIYTDWQEPYQKGVVYYLNDGHIRGVLLWNVWGQLAPARKLIADPGPFKVDDLRGRLPES
jgi:3-phenylpropionate/trans-cinnamate dioxygenase ferredoxin reductase subunit